MPFSEFSMQQAHEAFWKVFQARIERHSFPDTNLYSKDLLPGSIWIPRRLATMNDATPRVHVRQLG